jgi:AraC-like DNA-binding protein
MIRKREGFKDQRAIVLPQLVQKELRNRSMTKLLFVTDIGFYPAAHYHYRERQSGCEQNILIYCIEGSGWIEMNRVRKKVQKNQFIIIPADVPHSYWAENADPWTIYWVHFTGESAGSFIRKEFQVVDLSSDENTRNDRRTRLFDEIIQTLMMGYSAENLEYSSVCLWYLLGSFHYITQFERIRAIKQNDIIEKSILYMQNHIDKRITLGELANHCGFSVSQYSLIFKKKTSRSPMEYYNNLRIQDSCQLLDFTNMNIKEISSNLDFEDQFYFSRVFRKTMGISPLEYRKRKKG